MQWLHPFQLKAGLMVCKKKKKKNFSFFFFFGSFTRLSCYTVYCQTCFSSYLSRLTLRNARLPQQCEGSRISQSGYPIKVSTNPICSGINAASTVTSPYKYTLIVSTKANINRKSTIILCHILIGFFFLSMCIRLIRVFYYEKSFVFLWKQFVC